MNLLIDPTTISTMESVKDNNVNISKGEVNLTFKEGFPLPRYLELLFDSLKSLKVQDTNYNMSDRIHNIQLLSK